jgi:hypothetical protein
MNRAGRALLAYRSRVKIDADAALEYFKKHPDFVSAHIAVLDALHVIHGQMDQVDAYSSARLALVIQALDAVAAAYLPLVTDLAAQEFYAKLLNSNAVIAIEEYTGLSAAEFLFSGVTHPEKIIIGRTAHWNRESFRRLASLRTQPLESDSDRRGYRTEVMTWMKAEEIDTIPEAAKRLAISETTLKSIMSNKGEVRYGKDTLDRVLKIISALGE